jgi:hypothetical protein
LRRRLILVGLLAFPLQVSGQQTKRPVPLAIPEGEILRCVRPDGAQATRGNGIQSREFRVGLPETEQTPDGLERSRKITIAADSLGRPLLLLEETSLGWLGGVVVMRMFGHDSTKSMWQDISIDSVAMARAIAAVDVEGVSSAIHKLPHRTLTLSERDQADSLAAWLWARRCGRPGG